MTSASGLNRLALRRLWSYIGRYRGIYLFGLVCAALSQLLMLVTPLAVQYFVDGIQILPAGDTAALWKLTAACSAVVLVATLARGGLMYIARQAAINQSRRIELDMRGDLFAHLQTLPASFYATHPTGDIMSRCTADMEAVRMLTGPSMMHGVNCVTRLVSTFAAMLWIDRVLSGWVLGVGGCACLLLIALAWRMYRSSLAVQERLAAISGMALENLSGARVIKAFGREEREIERLRAHCDNHFTAHLRLVMDQGLSRVALTSLIGLLYLVLVFVGGRRIVSGELTIGALSAFFVLVSRLQWPLAIFGWIAGLIQRGVAGMRRIEELYEEAPETPVAGAPDVTADIGGDIEIRDLSFRYTEDRPWVLQGISLTIPKGRRLGILGRTGAGKSTLARMLTRQYPVPDGSVFIGGRDINTLPLPALRAAIATVPQDVFLFSETVRYNIGFSRETEPAFEDVEGVARQAALHEDILRFPNRYEQVIGERGVTLSGGQKQRTAIARAILKQAPVVIFDDSLSAVDTQTEEAILQALFAERTDVTMILIAHRISTISRCDDIVVLDDGRVAEHGSHAELLKRDGIYADIHRRQQLSRDLDEEPAAPAPVILPELPLPSPESEIGE